MSYLVDLLIEFGLCPSKILIFQKGILNFDANFKQTKKLILIINYREWIFLALAIDTLTDSGTDLGPLLIV